jgi:hypothetical protein
MPEVGRGFLFDIRQTLKKNGGAKSLGIQNASLTGGSVMNALQLVGLPDRRPWIAALTQCPVQAAFANAPSLPVGGF